jgi:hypothetical protein
MTRWPNTRGPPVSGAKGEGGYRFGNVLPGRGLDLVLGQIVSPGPFLILFFCSSFFPFSDSYFLNRTFKIAPNQFKPIPKIF